MHRRGLGQRDPPGNGAAPGDAALAVDPLEVTNEEHPKAGARGNARPPARLVAGRAELFGKRIKLRFGEYGVGLGIEGMPRPAHQLGGRNEQFGLHFFASS